MHVADVADATEVAIHLVTLTMAQEHVVVVTEW